MVLLSICMVNTIFTMKSLKVQADKIIQLVYILLFKIITY